MDVDSIEIECSNFKKCGEKCEFIERLMKEREELGMVCEVRCINSSTQTLVWTEN